MRLLKRATTKAKDRAKEEDANEQDDETPDATLPPPSGTSRWIGVGLLVVGAVVPLIAAGDDRAVELLGPDPEAGDTAGMVVRFTLVLLAAAVVEQIVELLGRMLGGSVIAEHNRPVILGGAAVLLGVAAARGLDLYLLHNIGFFGVERAEPMATILQDSSGGEKWGDAFMTGLVIAAGTKPIHDLSSRLRKTKTA